MTIEREIGHELRKKREEFLDLVEDCRGDLYRYCRSLTGDPWDGEDLVQEALLRGFVALSFRSGTNPVANPRGYLFRIATNAFLDSVRRGRKEQEMEEPERLPAPEAPPPAPELREALAALTDRLAPRERAAFLLFDCFDLTLEETARNLDMTTGAVKAALHRARTKLAELRDTRVRRPAVRRDARGHALLDAFAEAFNARDLDRVMSLFTADADAEIVGCLTEEDPETIREGSMRHTLFSWEDGSPLPEDNPGAEVVEIGGERMVVLFYVGEDGARGVGDLLRFTRDGDRIRRLRYWYFSPELIEEVAGWLEEPARTNGHRYG